jgi:hypothetical protein
MKIALIHPDYSRPGIEGALRLIAVVDLDDSVETGRVRDTEELFEFLITQGGHDQQHCARASVGGVEDIVRAHGEVFAQ